MSTRILQVSRPGAGLLGLGQSRPLSEPTQPALVAAEPSAPTPKPVARAPKPRPVSALSVVATASQRHAVLASVVHLVSVAPAGTGHTVVALDDIAALLARHRTDSVASNATRLEVRLSELTTSGHIERHGLADGRRGVRLTVAGRAFWRGVRDDVKSAAADGVSLMELRASRRRRTLDVATRVFLDRVMDCGVLQKAQRGTRLTEADARTLWGAHPCTPRAELLALAADTHACLRRILVSGTADDARRAAAVLIVHHQLARIVAIGGS